MKLRHKILVPVLSVVFISMTLAGLAIVHVGTESAETAQRRTLITVAHDMGNAASLQLQRAMTDARFASNLPGVRIILDSEPGLFGAAAFKTKRVHSILARMVETTGYYESAYLADVGGTIVSASQPAAIGSSNVFDQQCFQTSLQKNTPAISEPYRSPLTGQAMVSLCLPIAAGEFNGSHRGVLFGNLLIDKMLQKALQRVAVEPEWNVVMTTGSGMTVMSMQGADIGRVDYSTQPWFAALPPAREGIVAHEQNGEDILTAYFRTDDGWIALVSTQKSALFAPGVRIAWYGLAALLGACTVISVCIYLVVRRVTQDISALSQHANEVEQGHYDANFILQRNDELGALSRSLATMVEYLNKAVIRAEEASRSKSLFLANMSHEIRTPLNGIIGFAHILLQDSLLQQVHKDRVYKIHLSAQHLLGVINDILDFSKIEAQKMDIEKAPFSLTEVLQSVNALVRPAALTKHIDFSVVQEENVPAIVEGDGLRLSQILLNLCSNAVKFTAEGSVRVVVRCQEEREDCTVICFSVQDTGIGMSPAVVQRIFDAFTQADSSTSRVFGGTGLGLSISKRLSQLMQGDIRVQSTEGKGSEFQVILPFGKSSQQAALDIEGDFSCEVLPYLRDKHILVVDDNEINQEIAQELLTCMGARVSLASNGLEAVDLALKEDFDCILMDIQMPVMDGLTATQTIRESGKLSLQSLPIIAMTADAVHESRDKAKAVGMNGHLTKPVNPAKLKKVLEYWLDR